MLLDDLAASLDLEAPAEGAGVEVSDLVHDTRAVTPGALFACIRGARADGHALAGQAVAAGAVALLCEHAVDASVPQLIVPSTRPAMAVLADRLCGQPTRTLRVAGVTGTNGKTTTAYLVHAILEAAGLQAGLLGTVEQRVGGVAEPVAHTTPEADDLQRTFKRMLAAGDRACAIEVSSHALAMHRVDAVRFAAAAFTNLSQDHLDFHGSMEEYFAAKALLFDGRCPRATNLDDPWGARLEAELGYGIDAEAAAVRALDLELRPDGSAFTLRTPSGTAAVRMRLRGRFNVANALAAAAIGELMGLPLEAVVAGLGSMPEVPGRMEPVDHGQGFQVLVDYAHTPDALATVLTTARALVAPGGALSVVFGCGGDRDRDKRSKMGAAASLLADRVIVTTDNPRSEDPALIIAEILAGAERPVSVEPDRREAIFRAIAEASPGDVVLIAGKGHEQGQEAHGRKTPFDDRRVAAEALG